MTKGEWLKLFSFFYAIIQKNINFLRRSSKKDDFIIENIFEEGNIIDDKKIIELYFERNEQAIKETDIKYGKLCHKIAYNILNNLQDSEECVNDTYLGVWNKIPPTRPDNFKAYISKIVRSISIDKFRKQKEKNDPLIWLWHWMNLQIYCQMKGMLRAGMTKRLENQSVFFLINKKKWSGECFF